MFSYLGYLILFLSFLGYGLLIAKEFKVKSEFIPAIITSSTILSLYIASLLNIMIITSFMLVGIGIFILLYLVFFNKIEFKRLREFLSLGIIIFFTISLGIIIYYRNSTLIHYDNFSHWALIVKQLLIDNRLPNFSNELIAFKSYPPGSALFIYFISLFTQKTEGGMLIAQNILTLSFFVTLFGFIDKKKNIFSYLIVTITSVLMLSFSTGMNNILVDSLLPIMGLATTAIILYYKKYLRKAIFLSLPLITTLMIVKNSGIFFVIFNMLLLVIIFKRNTNSFKNKNLIKKDLLLVIIYIAMPFVLFMLWSKHVDLVFDSEALASSKHSMNLRNYVRTLLFKSNSDIKEVLRLFVNRATSMNSRPNILLIGWNIFVAISTLLYSKLNKNIIKKALRYLIICNLIYLVYQIGLLGMYLFSMPIEEALVLAGYERYTLTILSYIIGIFLIFILKELLSNKNKSLLKRGIIFVIMVGFIDYQYSYLNIINKTKVQTSSDNNTVYILEEVISDVPDIENGSFVIYYPSAAKDGGYTQLLSKYKLYSSKVKVIYSIENTLDFYETIKDSDYLLVLEKDSLITEFIDNNFNDLNESYLGSYEIKSLR